jgi:Mrp family chromosome partitioning ATPase
LDASTDENTGWLTLTATAKSPGSAADAASAYYAALIHYVQGDLRRQFRVEVVAAQRAVAAAPTPVQRQSASTQLSSLISLRDTATTPVRVVQTPQVGLASPHPMRNALLALLLAVLICPLLLVVFERLDRTVRRPANLQRISGTSLLAGIPTAAFAAHRVDADIERAFERLRDSLIYLDPDRRPRVVAIVSPLGNEGRTTVATGLAASFARAGNRVVLVDADLQTPGVAARAGVPEAPGLTEVLAGYELDGALRFAERFDGDLTVLPAGSPSAFASDLVGSAAMSRLLDQLSGRFDYVVVDTAPLLSSSGPLAIVGRVQGAVAIGRLNQTRRDAVARMMRLAGTVDGRVVGVVATNARGGRDDDVSEPGVVRWRAARPPRAPSATG